MISQFPNFCPAVLSLSQFWDHESSPTFPIVYLFHSLVPSVPAKNGISFASKSYYALHHHLHAYLKPHKYSSFN